MLQPFWTACAAQVDILNEECVRGNSGSDSNFVDKLLSFHKDHACLATPKIRTHKDGEALPFADGSLRRFAVADLQLEQHLPQ